MAATKDKKLEASSSELEQKTTKDQQEAELTSTVKPQTSKVAPAEKLAKAGKRSKKVQEEAAEVAAKEAKKVEKKVKAEEEADKPRVIQKPRVKRYSKNQKAARELLEEGKSYTLAEALELLPKLSKTKFDATAELHAALGIDPKAGDQQVRTSAALPAGSGKSVKIAVITDDKNATEAKKAGADATKADDILAAIGKGKFDFDVLIASPDKMGELGRHAKVLGPKGLMPSPKNGTVTTDVVKAVEEIKKGRAEIKNDANAVVHAAFGKLSFKPSDLAANAKSVIAALQAARPTSIKGTYIKSIYLTSSMSPSVKLDVNEAVKSAKE